MASCTEHSRVVSYTIELTPEELTFLTVLLDRVGGNPLDSYRKLQNSISEAIDQFRDDFLALKMSSEINMNSNGINFKKHPYRDQ